MRLGEFGAAQRELGGEKDDFVFCGEPFVVEQKLPAVLMLQLGAATTGKIDEAEGFAAIWRALEISLTKPAFKRPPQGDEKPGPDGMVDVPADTSPFRKLYNLAVDQGVELEPLMRLVMALFEAQTGRPTQQAPDSLAGPATTSPSSSTSSTLAAPLHLRSVDDLVRGTATTPGLYADVVQMGDGQIVEFVPAPKEQTG